jgi:AbrB family looped-hinge helix DNA binding protein
MLNLSVSSKGQLVIPSEVRIRYGIGEGTKLNLLETDKGLLLTHAPAFKPTQQGAARLAALRLNKKNIPAFISIETDRQAMMQLMLADDENTKSKPARR